MSFKQTLSRYLLNLPGWRTRRKIVVIESDDWGSIRMPSREVYEKLLKAGIRVDNCHYCSNDCLETEEDLSMLFEVLHTIKDKYGNPALVTANTLVANPDFKKIKESDFKEYHYKKITEGFQEFKGSENVLELYNQGLNANCFKMQFHGREHLNVTRWIEALNAGWKETRLAFELGVYGLSTTITSENRKSFLPAFDFDTSEEELQVNEIAKDGLRIFEEIFGYPSKSFIAPNYVWGESLEQIIQTCGVVFIQGTQWHRYIEINKKKSKRRLRYTGKRNRQNQIDLARNALFEPTENTSKDWLRSCMADINRAFLCHKPAIVCSHRVNFMGGINKSNRDNNLKLLKELLLQIKAKWPDVEFMSSDQLGELIQQKQ
jgi:hypothetical protein